jgi:hypothetical protein
MKKSNGNTYAAFFCIFAQGLGVLFPSPGQATNIAPIYGVATTNDFYNGYIPDNAIHGDWGSAWNGGNYASLTNPYWLQVDLQGSYKIGKIVLVGPVFMAGYTKL